MEFKQLQLAAVFDQESSSRRRRDGSADEIGAEFETVFNVLAEKDSASESGVAAAAQTELESQIENEVAEKIEEATGRTVGDQGGYKAGELNFFRQATADDVQPVVFEQAVLAGYGDYIMDCNCDTGERVDYALCSPSFDDRDVRPCLLK